MNRWKSVCAVVLTFALIFSLLPVNGLALAKGKSTLVIIHYKEDKTSEKDWNLWLWANGPDYFPNKAHAFNGEDAYGKIAAYEFPVDQPEKIGLIVRDDNWNKDSGSENDRFITKDMIKDGVAEVWIASGSKDVSPVNPTDGADVESIKTNVHYYRYDNDYEKYGVWAWPNAADGQRVEFNQQDEFGAVTTVSLANPTKQRLVGIIPHIEGWSEKDGADRFFYAGAKDIWLIEGDQTIYYGKPEIDRTPKITSFLADDFKKLTLKTNAPVSADDIGQFSFTGLVNPVVTQLDAKTFEVAVSTDIDLAKVVTVTHPVFGEGVLEAGQVLRSDAFDQKYAYDGKLGVTYKKSKTTFRLWAPTAQTVELELYKLPKQAAATTKDITQEIEMKRGDRGVFTVTVKGDLDGTGYTYEVKHAKDTTRAVDPYATAVAVNGDQGVVVDLKETDPKRWTKSKMPLKQATDAIIYETHVRDLSMFDVTGSGYDSGIKQKGKYLGVVERGTRLMKDGQKTKTRTGLDHLKELGITHVQFIPVYDFNTASVDETNPLKSYNWGYDPKNYNTPEGSYATNPYDPKVRITEMKQMIQGLHDNGLRAVMDVVYNHMFDAKASNLDKIVPGYYYRYTAGGDLANGTGVGNDTASERQMMHKLIVDSVGYWAKEYHWDGFRFDLMGIHDVKTMNAVKKTTTKIDPSILVFGEGWSLNTPLPETEKANQTNAKQMPGVAHFNDNLRDALKGSVFEDTDAGFINGKTGLETRIKRGIVGEIAYNQDITGFAAEPNQTITYVEAHDNHTLWDKLNLTNPNDTDATKTKMHRLASSILLTSQGTTFIHAGQDFMRTKGGDHNSYKSPDSVNQLDWKRKMDRQQDVDYMKGLIEVRKANPALHLGSAKDIRRYLTFVDTMEQVVAYQLSEDAPHQKAELFVVHNAKRAAVKLTLPKGKWKLIVDGKTAGTKTLRNVSGSITVDPLSSFVLKK
ncbi:type I pullulanase [Exiguobacterium sp. s127]|uniref:type I pullulanase n=1 Tax=Exiguobacterium sp. s127 TaxID=2751210 RepID=UPI001BE925B5|nr:type I pullulanase [Exiguobacterium sp. s127]